MNDKKPEQLTEGEIALMDAIKSIIDVMLESGVPPQAFERNFVHQRDGYIRTGRPKAAGMLEMLRLFATDPQRAASRQQRSQTLREPPKGQA
jgi:hypothetical protein